MTILINTDKTINGNEKHQNYFSAEIAEELKRFESHVTRIEVHLKDENGKKEGFNDMSCVLEARLEGRQPIVVRTQANTVELAVSEAIQKMKVSLNTIVGRLQNH